jgi:hypothetical protein
MGWKIMITKFVLIVWVGIGSSEVLSTQSFDTRAECEAVAAVLKAEMSTSGWYSCKPYTFDGDEK